MASHIEAVSVNHSTSAYMELMLRSLVTRRASTADLSVTIYDNASEDDMTGLQSYAQRVGVPIVPSGYTTHSQHNSHGELLCRFVLEHPACTHYLFLDTDVCFIEDRTLDVMLEELEGTPDAFGIGARLSWDGMSEIPEDVRRGNPDLYTARLHPCCALIKNTELFRRVVGEFGLSELRRLLADREEFIDTCKLMIKVMLTHGLRHIISSRMVLHFFCVSYDYQHYREERDRRRDVRLAQLRQEEAGA